MPKITQIGNRTNNSSPATAPSRATSAHPQDYPAICGIDITNGIRYIAAIEKAVRDGILGLPRVERKSALSLYRISFRVAANGITSLSQKLKEEGQL